MHNSIEQINKLKNQAINTASDLQPWPNYYRLRAKELEVLCSIYALKKVNRTLEIGCSNGFTSAILSRFSNEVIATDLLNLDRQTHSIGISKARELIERLNIDNCRIISCSAEELPFEDKSFDLVFCAYTLEHISKQNKALREVLRILKISGESIFLVPNFMDRVFFPFSFYPELFKKLIPRSSARKEQQKADNNSATRIRRSKRFESAKSKWHKFLNSYPHFPIPEPHGIYDNFFHELIQWTPRQWEKLFQFNGFKIKSVFSTMLMPKTAIGVFADSLGIYEKYSWIDKRLGNNKILRKFGQNICIISRK